MKNALLVAGGLALAFNAGAANYDATQLTNDVFQNEYAKINAQDDVIWAAWVDLADTGWTVFKYDAATQSTNALSTANVFYDSHRINNAGDVVWMASDGADQEIFLYQAASNSVVQLTNNTLDDTAPEISDNGDVSWFEQRGVNVGAFLFRYDAQTQTVTGLDFPGASRQGMQTMNARGDIAWNAEVTTVEIQNGQAVPVTNAQDILLFDAATNTIGNVTRSYDVIDSNQRLLDNGDVVWEAYDLLSSVRSLKVYHPATAAVTEIAADVGNGYEVGAGGHAAWITNDALGTVPGYTLSLYDPVTGTARAITTEPAAFPQVITGVSAQGDVVWRSIIGTTWYSRYYNAATQAIVDLTATQAFGTYDLVMADNGDAMWSLWDGTDYEVYSYQKETGATTQLSNNTVDDGIAVMNAAGSILWNRFFLDDNELMLAVKTDAEVPDLRLNVSQIDWNARAAEAEVAAKFVYGAIPDAGDVIRVSFDGAVLLDIALGDFEAEGAGVYRYRTPNVKARIDFKKGTLKVSSRGVDTTSVNIRDGIDVELRIGAAVAVDHVKKPRR